jgi:hypothetical protein
MSAQLGDISQPLVKGPMRPKIIFPGGSQRLRPLLFLRASLANSQEKWKNMHKFPGIKVQEWPLRPFQRLHPLKRPHWISVCDLIVTYHFTWTYKQPLQSMVCALMHWSIMALLGVSQHSGLCLLKGMCLHCDDNALFFSTTLSRGVSDHFANI